MTALAKHTPGPLWDAVQLEFSHAGMTWDFSPWGTPNEANCNIFAVGVDDEHPPIAQQVSIPDAALIVRSVNAHGPLVEALQALVEVVAESDTGDTWGLVIEARAALALAGAK